MILRTWIRLLGLFILSGLMTVPWKNVHGFPSQSDSPSQVYLPFVTMNNSSFSVRVLANTIKHYDSSGNLHVAGEVINETGSLVENINVLMYLVKASGDDLLPPDDVFLLPTILPSGQKTCFEIITQPTQPFSTYRFEPPSYDITTHQPPNLVFSNLSGRYISTANFQLSGYIRNAGTVKLQGVKVIATLYNETGDVVACRTGLPSTTTLNPNQTTSFTILVDDCGYKEITSWKVLGDGY